jgi:hypothetical protein
MVTQQQPYGARLEIDYPVQLMLLLPWPWPVRGPSEDPDLTRKLRP